MYKYIFCDLDGTLFDDDKNISQENVGAISRAENLGVSFIPCTGRLPYCLIDYIKPLKPSDYVSTNGSIVVHDGDFIQNITMAKEDALKVINYAEEYNLSTRVFTKDYLYIVNNTDAMWSYQKQKEVDWLELHEILKEKEVVKIVFILDKGYTKVAKDIANMNLNIEISYSSDIFLEINAIGIDKGKGIKKYCDALNININEVIGIGDNGNDIPMLKTVGFPCCPNNAIDEVKQICKYVSPYTNNQSAIADIIKNCALADLPKK